MKVLEKPQNAFPFDIISSRSWFTYRYVKLAFICIWLGFKTGELLTLKCLILKQNPWLSGINSRIDFVILSKWLDCFRVSLMKRVFITKKTNSGTRFNWDLPRNTTYFKVFTDRLSTVIEEMKDFPCNASQVYCKYNSVRPAPTYGNIPLQFSSKYDNFPFHNEDVKMHKRGGFLTKVSSKPPLANKSGTSECGHILIPVVRGHDHQHAFILPCIEGLIFQKYGGIKKLMVGSKFDYKNEIFATFRALVIPDTFDHVELCILSMANAHTSIIYICRTSDALYIPKNSLRIVSKIFAVLNSYLLPKNISHCKAQNFSDFEQLQSISEWQGLVQNICIEAKTSANKSEDEEKAERLNFTKMGNLLSLPLILTISNSLLLTKRQNQLFRKHK
ncbi:hypothetical protein EGR_06238 [Echinococcus granulosus]|uniref:Uncharacterized protein n=1 Tax=Echinococcus granulosus TaxID=6210 RepID=W6ULD1_ECHGR|nr:hypothetical protein EGR_06238 [Echinococcus granulosus]EUB58922.1 hypothetical protein EGR_06238 [Echinococcus granulosus]